MGISSFTVRCVCFLILVIVQLTCLQTNAATLTVENTDDSGTGSLRQIVLDATPGDTIVFDETVFPDAATGTIILSSGAIVIDKALTISGGGRVTIDGNDNSRIFTIDDGLTTKVNIYLSGLILTNGYETNGGAVYNKENLAVDDSVIHSSTASGYGGGIYN